MGCFAHNNVPYAWTIWFGIFVFESCLVGLASYKCIINYRDRMNAPQLLKVLLRDSILFYGGVSVVALVNCLVWAFGRVSRFFLVLSDIHTWLAFLVHCLRCVSMLLSARILHIEYQSLCSNSTNPAFLSILGCRMMVRFSIRSPQLCRFFIDPAALIY